MPAPKFNPKPQIGQSQVELMYKAIPIMLPVPLGLEGVASQQRYGPWKRPVDLANEAMTATDTNNIKDAYYVLTQWQETYSNPPEYEVPTMTEMPKSSAEANMINTDTLKEMQRQNESNEARRKVVIEQSNQNVHNAIKRQQEIHEQEVQKVKIQEAKLKNQKIYYKAEVQNAPTLNDKQQEAINSLKELSKSNPKEEVTKAQALIQQKIIGIPEAEAKKAALNIVQNLNSNSLPTEKAAVIQELSVRQDLLTDREVFGWAINLANQKQNDLIQSRIITESAFGKEFSLTVFPSYKVQLSSLPQDGFEKPFDLQDIASLRNSDLNDRISFLKDIDGDFAKSSIEKQARSFIGAKLDQQIANLVSQGLISERTSGLISTAFSVFGVTAPIEWVAIEGSVVGQFAMSTGLGPVFGMLGQATNSDVFGIAAGGVVGAGTETAIGIAAASYAATGTEIAITGGAMASEAFLGGAGTAMAAGAAAGSAFPVVGTIIGAVGGLVTSIVGPKVINWIKDKLSNVGNYLFAGLGAGIGGVIGASTGIGVLGGALVGGGLGYLGAGAFTGGLPAVGASLSSAASATTGAFGAMWSTFMAGVGAPILAILIGFPVLVVFILIIINSGAYMVPPGTALINSTNPYLDVQKVASPNGQLDTPQTITYTVTITAKKDDLTAVSFQYDCNAIKKDGTKKSCKSLETIPPAPTTIPVSTPFTFTFTSDYDSTYSDSLVTDTFTVNATSPSGGKVTQTGSASVCFGDCPLNCFNFDDPSWTANSMTNLQSMLSEAAGTLVGTYPDFAAKVCPAGGPVVKICYTTNDPSPGSGIFARHVNDPGGCTFNFNKDVEPYGPEGVLFLLTHEVGHHIQALGEQGFTDYYSMYLDQVNPPTSESYICTRGADDPYESMAEGNALFVADPVIDANRGCLTNSFQNQYPLHYSFAKNVMFAP